MSQAEAQMQILNLALIVADTVVYFVFGAIALAWNKIARREVLSRRVVGALGVVLFTACAMLFAGTYLINEQVLSRLSPFDQGRYVGQVVAIPVFPALLVLGIVGIRGWLVRRKRKSLSST
jgi:uncharacterized membrane protein YqjE